MNRVTDRKGQRWIPLHENLSKTGRPAFPAGHSQNQSRQRTPPSIELFPDRIHLLPNARIGGRKRLDRSADLLVGPPMVRPLLSEGSLSRVEQ